MNNNELLAMLRCPQDRSMLSIADESLILSLNRAIKSAKIVNSGNQKVKKQLDGGLLRTAGDLLYPIVDGIPILLSDEAIEIAQLDKTAD